MCQSIQLALDRLCTQGLSYKWGHPFHLIVRNRNHTFALKRSSELPNLFLFADLEPIQVPDWLNFSAAVHPSMPVTSDRQTPQGKEIATQS